MSRLKFALLAFVLMGLSIVASCHDNDRNEQQPGASKTTKSTQAAARGELQPVCLDRSHYSARPLSGRGWFDNRAGGSAQWVGDSW